MVGRIAVRTSESQARMSHRKAVWVMAAAAMMWSIAGVVTRQLEAVRSFELTFWRSGFNALALVALLAWLRGPAALRADLLRGGPALWLSGLCWAVMFTAFMIALTLTTVANVLVTMSIGPLLTALGARFALGQRLALRTWLAIAVAGVGIVWMYGHAVGGDGARPWLGTAMALGVPVAAALNWNLLQFRKRRAVAPDMLAAVLVGALLSAVATLPLALPFAASAHDLALLALLGGVQLAIPCLMAVAAAHVLSAPEVSLLSLLEVVFGVGWAWIGAGEIPQPGLLGGGALVLAALAVNEVMALRSPRPAGG